MIRSTDDQPMTTAERYSSAIDSSNLRMKERGGDVDLIAAAGLADHPLAGSLLRLSVEYDLVRSEHQAAQARMRHREAEAKRQKGEVDGVSAEQRTDDMEKLSVALALTDHLLILTALPSLLEVKNMLGAVALNEASRVRFMAPPDYILRLTGSVLDVHLAPNCRHCEGRGFSGNLQRGERQAVCRPCKGSGSRRDSIGKDDEDRAFAGHLLLMLNELVGIGERQISQKRHEVRTRKALILEAEARGVS